MHFMETDDSSDESMDMSYPRKRSLPVCYSSDEDTTEPENDRISSSCDEFSNSHLDTNAECQGEEWQQIQRTEIQKNVAEHEHTWDADLLAKNVNCEEPFMLYKLFVTDSILQLMVEETNKYAVQCGFSAKRRKSEQCWEPVTISEMKVFVAILLIMGIIQMPDVKLYWSKNDIYANERIKNVMKRDRFVAILKYLHFSDNSTYKAEEPLNKISKIVSELITTFKNTVRPGKTVVIDESTILWCGRLHFCRYINGKRHKCNVKLYKLCLPKGYTYDLDIFTGKSMNPSINKHTYDVVSKLMNGLLFEHRVLYTDSYCSSVPLAQSLLQKGTCFCGTVPNGKFVPLDKKEKQKCGELTAFENPSGIKFVKWTDKRTVCIITSCPNHTCGSIEGKPSQYKPDFVFDYNNAKRSIALADQTLSYYSCLRKTIKWYKKIVIQLICGTAVANAYYIHKQWGHQKMSILKFREVIIDKLLADEDIPRAQVTSNDKHFIETYLGPAKCTRKRCRECYRKLSEKMGATLAAKKAKRVRTFCGLCKNQPPLCLQCFKETHENK